MKLQINKEAEASVKLTKILTKTCTAISMFLVLLIAATIVTQPLARADVYFPAGTQIPTYAYINVAPNPIGVGQTVNVNFFLATAVQSGEGPTNMTVKITDPDDVTTTYGPYTGDTTGGSFFNFVPDKVGEWKFQFFYGGQTTTAASFFGIGYADLVMMPSESKVATLTVQEEPVTQTAYPITPLPSNYWETPVSAQNVQEWYKIMGPWLGLGNIPFAYTGLYNCTSTCNPYTDSILSGHILWTKPWGPGGVVGGDAGGNEVTGSYWTPRQYWPQYAPVIMDGKMYSQYYPEATSYSAGIVCTDLFTGETLFTIDTDSTLLCGMITQWKTANTYGAVGPYLWTFGDIPASETGGNEVVSVGTAYHLFSATTGQYVLSVVNCSMSHNYMPPSAVFKADENGNLIGYFINSTVGSMRTYKPASSAFGGPELKEVVNITATTPMLCCFNMSMALSSAWGWSPTENSVIDFATTVMWAKPIPTEINGVPIDPALSYATYGNNYLTGNEVLLTSGELHTSEQSAGSMVFCSMDQTTGDVVTCKNYTYPTYGSLLPFTRYRMFAIDGVRIMINYVNWKCDGISTRTGEKLWEMTLKTPYGDGTPNIYGTVAGCSLMGIANGRLVISSYGGDIWAINPRTGEQLWYTNTTTLIGDPGIETPYGIWPIWEWSSHAFTKDVGYITIGHEYNPPLFHGAQIIAINLTNGELLWNELGTFVHSTAIAYNTMLSLNCYDNQIYAFGKGPTAMTVSAPNVGVTTETPITITGTVMDVSAGVAQSEVAKNFPNGLPCVSDESQSKWMEYVYQNQPCPGDATGVEVTLSVLDDNGNFREIGTTTSDGNGVYIFTWTPDIPGQYTLYASFAGSNSYYPSSAKTGFYASEAAGPTAPPEYPQPIDPTVTIIVMGIAIIIVVIIIGLLIYRKR